MEGNPEGVVDGFVGVVVGFLAVVVDCIVIVGFVVAAEVVPRKKKN